MEVKSLLVFNAYRVKPAPARVWLIAKMLLHTQGQCVRKQAL